jgi:hypothetical protein
MNLHTYWTLPPEEQALHAPQRAHQHAMTVADYFAYVRDYQRQLLDATILARAGAAFPTPEEQDELDALYDDEDPWTIIDEPFVLYLEDRTAC